MPPRRTQVCSFFYAFGIREHGGDSRQAESKAGMGLLGNGNVGSLEDGFSSEESEKRHLKGVLSTERRAKACLRQR